MRFEHTSMPTDWGYWHEVICNKLQIQPNIPIRSQRIKGPWFLIPNSGELSPIEANQLFELIRSLVSLGNNSFSYVKKVLSKLKPDESLPFLYAMRFVGFREAGRNSYWPAFRKLLFNDVLSYEEVALGLAPITSDLWLNLYEESNGSLYFPRQGKRHIKWPLAHAGLLPEDKTVLHAFGSGILQIEKDVYDEYLSLEVEEFVLIFRDWLKANPGQINNRFSSLMLSNRQERNIIAELGQQWLFFHKNQILATVLSISTRTSERQIYLRRRLKYDQHTNQIALVFSAGRIDGWVEPSIRWSGEDIPFRIRYFAQENVTIPDDLSIPLLNPKWQDKTKLQVRDEIYEVSLPVIEKKGNVIFDAYSGFQTQKWEFGREYYLLINGQAMDASVFDLLFKEWFQVGQPIGAWEDYLIIWATTTDPFIKSDGKGQRNLSTIIAEYEELADRSGFPSFGHQLDVRCSLIGGGIVIGHPPFSSFLKSQPPLLEIRGFWQDNLDIVLYRSDERSGKLSIQAALSIDSQYSGLSPVIELWKDSGDAGLYKINLNKTELQFVLLDEKPNPLDEAKQFNLEVSLLDEHNREIKVTRFNVLETRLNVNAWPFANLQLEILDPSGISHYFRNLQTDASGIFSRNLRELTVDLSRIPPGPIEIVVTWRGIISQSAFIEEQSYILPTSVDIKTDRQKEGEYQLHIRGLIKGSQYNDAYFVYVMAHLPWSEAPKLVPVFCTNDEFVADANLQWLPGWVHIFGCRNIEEPFKEVRPLFTLQVGQMETSELDSINLNPTREEYFTTWQMIASWILDTNYPVEFGPYVQVESLLSFLHETKFQELMSPSWIFVNTWTKFTKLIHSGLLEHPTAIYRWVGQSETLNAQLSNEVQFTFEEENESKVSFSFSKPTHHESAGVLSPDNHLDTSSINLLANTRLRVCSRCGLVTTLEYFKKHQPPSQKMQSCIAQNQSFTDILENQTSKANYCVGIFVDFREDYENLIAILKKILYRDGGDLSKYEQLLKSLRDNADTFRKDPTIALEELINCLDLLSALFLYENPPATLLMNMSESIPKNPEALRIIMKHFSEIRSIYASFG